MSRKYFIGCDDGEGGGGAVVVLVGEVSKSKSLFNEMPRLHMKLVYHKTFILIYSKK